MTPLFPNKRSYTPKEPLCTVLCTDPEIGFGDDIVCFHREKCTIIKKEINNMCVGTWCIRCVYTRWHIHGFEKPLN